RHYEVPRTSIFTSGIVLDEAHLYGGDPGSGDERSLFTAFIVGIKALAEARVPLLIESATLPKQLIDIMMDTIKGVGITPYLISFKYGTKCEEAVKSGNILECHDDDYVAKCLDINWMTEVIEDDKVVEVVKNHISVGHKVLIVRNTVDKAVKTYLKLREMFDDVEIIHGRFTKRDRAEKLRKCRAARLVVSTQVIEAGVNISFNVLITDAASPSSIVQRAGRVLRLFEDRDAYVYVVKSDGDGVYDKSVTTNFVSKLGEITKDSRHIIDWRIPSNGLINHNSRISFIKLLNEAYQGLELTIDPKRYVRFLDVISLPITTQKDLNKVYEESKGLVYSSILFPVYVYEKPPNTL
ncbi:MAG: CRISPR-associated helicase Cas3', partial [Sulfolobales archaeon]